jgi:hypothetical protein
MKFPNWVCVTCGKPSSRKWNIKRHIQICHGSIGRYVSFIEYMTGRQNGLYQPSQYPNSFYGSSKNKVNLPEKMIEEFSIELARQLARLHFNPAIRTKQNVANNNNPWSIPLWPEVVGYLGYVCKDCRVIDPLPMYLTSLGLIQKRHECSPQRLPDVDNILDKQKQISELYANLPEVMKKVVKSWTNNQNYIFAVEVRKEEISNHNVVDLEIITTTDKNNWAARAIKYNQTMLTEEELMDFLRRCNYNTFSYFKFPRLFHHEGLYYIIWIAPIGRSTNKSNDEGSNSISSIPTPEPEMTLEEFFLTTKSY